MPDPPKPPCLFGVPPSPPPWSWTPYTEYLSFHPRVVVAGTWMAHLTQLLCLLWRVAVGMLPLATRWTVRLTAPIKTCILPITETWRPFRDALPSSRLTQRLAVWVPTPCPVTTTRVLSWWPLGRWRMVCVRCLARLPLRTNRCRLFASRKRWSPPVRAGRVTFSCPVVLVRA